jgi:serine/threonine-protein kinase
VLAGLLALVVWARAPERESPPALPAAPTTAPTAPPALAAPLPLATATATPADTPPPAAGADATAAVPAGPAAAAPPPPPAAAPTGKGAAGPATKPARTTTTAKRPRAAKGPASRDARPVAAAALATGSLRLAISPWGTVEIDGAPAGTAPPLTQLSLPEGRHTVTVRNADFPAYTTTVQVSADAPVTVRHRFAP